MVRRGWLGAAAVAAVALSIAVGGCGSDSDGDVSVVQRYEEDGSPVLSIADSGGEEAVWSACTPDCAEIGSGRVVRPDPTKPAGFVVEFRGETADAGHWNGPLRLVRGPDLAGVLAIGQTVRVEPVATWEGGWVGDLNERVVEICLRRTSSSCHPVGAELPDIEGARWVRAVDVRRPATAPQTAEAYEVGKGPTMAGPVSAAVGPYRPLVRGKR